MARKWQPIATAPKDGTLIILWGDSGDIDDSWAIARWCHCNSQWRTLHDHEEFHATHWYPLPVPPIEASAPAEKVAA